jgi:hypothetical protein
VKEANAVSRASATNAATHVARAMPGRPSETDDSTASAARPLIPPVIAPTGVYTAHFM